MKKKILLTLVSTLLLATTMTGCMPFPTRTGIKSCVKKVASNEKYKVVDYDGGAKCVMTFESKERDLEFHGYGTLNTLNWNTSSSCDDLVNASYSTDYVAQVKMLYKDDAIDALLDNWSYAKEDEDLDNNETTFSCSATYTSEDDIEELAKAIYKCDKVYKQELDYNDEKWLEKYPLMLVRIHYVDKNDSSVSQWTFIYIDGSHDRDEIEEKLSDNIDAAIKKAEKNSK